MNTAGIFFNSDQMLTLQRSQVGPIIEFGSRLWAGAPKYLINVLEYVEKRATYLIKNTLSNAMATTFIGRPTQEPLVTFECARVLRWKNRLVLCCFSLKVYSVILKILGMFGLAVRGNGYLKSVLKPVFM